MNEDIILLSKRDKIQVAFEMDIKVIEKMISEMKSERYNEYKLRLNLGICCPFQDAIRYRFIMAVEVFKKFAQALSFTYFKYDSTEKK